MGENDCTMAAPLQLSVHFSDPVTPAPAGGDDDEDVYCSGDVVCGFGDTFVYPPEDASELDPLETSPIAQRKRSTAKLAKGGKTFKRAKGGTTRKRATAPRKPKQAKRRSRGETHAAAAAAPAVGSQVLASAGTEHAIKLGRPACDTASGTVEVEATLTASWRKRLFAIAWRPRVKANEGDASPTKVQKALAELESKSEPLLGGARLIGGIVAGASGIVVSKAVNEVKTAANLVQTSARELSELLVTRGKEPVLDIGTYGMDPVTVAERLNERFPGRRYTVYDARIFMHSVGANAHGRISEHDFECIVAREANLRRRVRLPGLIRRTLIRARETRSVPREKYRNGAVNVDRSALLRLLPSPSGVAWGGLVAFSCQYLVEFSVHLDTMNDRSLVKATASGRNTILAYLAQAGAVEKLKLVMARPAVRAIVSQINAVGLTALDYAVAIRATAVIDILSCYHQEHLDMHHVDPKTEKRLLSRNTRAMLGGRTKSRQSFT